MTNVVSFLPNHVGLSCCRHGVFAYFKNDKYIGKSLDFYGEYSEYEVGFLASMLRPGAVVIDVGANIGALTIPMARVVGSDTAVFAYEPQRTSFQLLCANVVLNGITNVIPKQMAVGRKAGSVGYVEINRGLGGNFGAVQVSEEPRSPISTPMVRLDDEGVFPSLIKIDVEGMEVDVLLGAEKLIKKCRPTIYVENDRPEKARELVGTLIEFGYDCHWHTPLMFNKDNWHGQTENLWPGVGSFNMVCVPREMQIVFAGSTPITIETAVHPCVEQCLEEAACS